MKSPKPVAALALFLMLLQSVPCSMAQVTGRYLVPVTFSHTWDVGFDHALFVVGAAAELGAWDPTKGVRLRWNTGNIWTGQIALPAGQTHEYKFVRRNIAPEFFCSSGNADWMGGPNLSVSTPAAPAPPFEGKTIFYLSSWPQVFLIHRTGSGAWTGATMEQAGPGRHAGEFLYRVDGVGQTDQQLEFVFHDGASGWDHAPYEGPTPGNFNFFTALDTLWVQDDHVFNYAPPPSLSAPRVEHRLVGSTVSEIPERWIHIYLPRGYDQNTNRRYPVLYMHDGQNLFSPGGAFGSWDADLTATREIAMGRMRECILVAIDNGTNRRGEYEPPGDRYIPTEVPGIGDKYLRFVLENVRPTLDFNYRTLTSPRNTLIGGSSMGGLISVYFGYATNVFGSVMAMSPAMTRANNFTADLWNRARQPLRIYCDTGNSEGQVGPTPGGDYWYKPWEAYVIFQKQGYAMNGDLLMRIGCGHGHNEAAWAQRLPAAFRFLLDSRDEPNLLAQSAHPPRLSTGIRTDGTAEWTTETLHRFAYRLERLHPVPQGTWSPYRDPVAESMPWGRVEFTGTPTEGFFRVVAEPNP